MSYIGRRAYGLNQPFVDKTASKAWLTWGELFPETEDFALAAIQEQLVNMRNYLNYSVKDPKVRDGRCKEYKEKPETIQHVTASCTPTTSHCSDTPRHTYASG